MRNHFYFQIHYLKRSFSCPLLIALFIHTDRALRVQGDHRGAEAHQERVFLDPRFVHHIMLMIMRNTVQL